MECSSAGNTRKAKCNHDFCREMPVDDEPLRNPDKVPAMVLERPEHWGEAGSVTMVATLIVCALRIRDRIAESQDRPCAVRLGAPANYPTGHPVCPDRKRITRK